MATMISNHEGGEHQQETCDNPALAFLGQGKYPLNNKTKPSCFCSFVLFC